MEKQTYEKLAYYTIKEKILSGNLRVGDRVTETVIADELKISRTPVRKALASLEKEGLIEVRTNRGAIVIESSMSVNRFVELLEITEIMINQTLTKVENKRIQIDMGYFQKKVEQLKMLHQKGEEDQFIAELFNCFFAFIRLMQNTYANRFVQMIESDFDSKAQKEIKIIPFILAEKTIRCLEVTIQNVQDNDFVAARKEVQTIMNQYIVQTFR
ncbi:MULTISPECIES: GntR family transcriptional regulator [Listeria]|uniref:GntR family transcriptional regulator n=1 Tax=Listeria TaxID=1637 RepID=UPI000B58CB02|nr:MULTISPECIES: GntR family transcriptional regulator [Listeria]